MEATTTKSKVYGFESPEAMALALALPTTGVVLSGVYRTTVTRHSETRYAVEIKFAIGMRVGDSIRRNVTVAEGGWSVNGMNGQLAGGGWEAQPLSEARIALCEYLESGNDFKAVAR